ncbi:MAG: hypothetical protein U0U46_06490 [Saprospiraceae bacterium]|nr:hypothetical protein [Saprospiraceae bacterium]
MTDQWWHVCWLSLGFTALFVAAEVMHRKFGVASEWSRKFMHISGGLLSLLLPQLFDNPWFVFGLVVAFGGLLWGSRRLGWLDSVHRVDRKSDGSLLFPLPILLCFLLAWARHDWVLFRLPILILVLADPAAFLVGRVWPLRPWTMGANRKTLGGSLAFMLAALACSLYFLPENPALAVVVSLLTAAAEALSVRGWDNLTVPLVAAGTLAAVAP